MPADLKRPVRSLTNCSCVQSRVSFRLITLRMVYNNLGDKERALYWLEKAYDIRDPKMTFLKTMHWKNVENDPRFQDILRRVGLVGAK